MMNKKLTLLSAALSVAASAPVYADFTDPDGHNMISAGWLYVAPRTSSTPLATIVEPPPFNGAVVQSPGTSATVSKESTLGLTYTYYASDHFGLQLIGGVPPKFDLNGSGASPFGDLSQNRPLATVKLYSESVLGLYEFLDPSYRLRPYAGFGVVFTQFKDIKLNPGFVNQIKTAAAAQGLGPVNVGADADSAFDPVVTLGLNYKFASHWYGQFSVSYVPLETNAYVTTNSQINGQLLTYSSTHVKLDPFITYLGAGYRF